MNRTYRGGAVTPDPSLFTAVMEGQWEVVREKVSASTHELLHRTCPAIYSPNRRSFRLPNKNLTEPPHHLPLSSQLLSLATTAARKALACNNLAWRMGLSPKPYTP